MTEREQIQAFAKEIRSVIARFRGEFDVTYESVIGSLEIIKGDLMDELRVNSQPDEQP